MALSLKNFHFQNEVDNENEENEEDEDDDEEDVEDEDDDEEDVDDEEKILMMMKKMLMMMKKMLMMKIESASGNPPTFTKLLCPPHKIDMNFLDQILKKWGM